jgi:hypothetical protein
MAFTYVLGTNVGTIRLLIPDREAAEYFFEDAELEALQGIQVGATDTIKNMRAAATALEILASDEAYTLKMVKLLDLTTNGPATAEELRARAARLWDEADALESASTADFDWAEWVVNDFSGRERIDAESLRSGS